MYKPSGENCIMIKTTSHIRWNDDHCSKTYVTICQLKTASGTCEYVLDKDKTFFEGQCRILVACCISVLVLPSCTDGSV